MVVPRRRVCRLAARTVHWPGRPACPVAAWPAAHAFRARSHLRSRRGRFAPAELVPGFALHQTDRHVSKAEAAAPSAAGAGRCAAASRRRDFDLLGYRYSLLAAVGTGGANLVLNMLPARDEVEEEGGRDSEPWPKPGNGGRAVRFSSHCVGVQPTRGVPRTTPRPTTAPCPHTLLHPRTTPPSPLSRSPPELPPTVHRRSSAPSRPTTSPSFAAGLHGPIATATWSSPRARYPATAGPAWARSTAHPCCAEPRAPVRSSSSTPRPAR